MKKEFLNTLVTTAKYMASNDKVRAFVCGCYSDGTTRSLPDIISGEYLSPKEKKKAKKKKKKLKNKKKKKKDAKFKL